MSDRTESVRLSEDRRAALEAVAEAVGADYQRGTEAGKPSWRSLIYAIADGFVACRPTKKRPK